MPQDRYESPREANEPGTAKRSAFRLGNVAWALIAIGIAFAAIAHVDLISMSCLSGMAVLGGVRMRAW